MAPLAGPPSPDADLAACYCRARDEVLAAEAAHHRGDASATHDGLTRAGEALEDAERRLVDRGAGVGDGQLSRLGFLGQLLVEAVARPDGRRLADCLRVAEHLCPAVVGDDDGAVTEEGDPGVDDGGQPSAEPPGSALGFSVGAGMSTRSTTK